MQKSIYPRARELLLGYINCFAGLGSSNSTDMVCIVNLGQMLRMLVSAAIVCLNNIVVESLTVPRTSFFYFSAYYLLIQRFGVVYRVISHESLVFSWCTHSPNRKIRVTSGYSMVYRERALHHCFISYLRKYSGQQNQCEIRAALDGKVGCSSTVQYETALLYSDWLYVLWYDIN